MYIELYTSSQDGLVKKVQERTVVQAEERSMPLGTAL